MTQLGIIAALTAEAKCLTVISDNKRSDFTRPQRISADVCLMISGIGPAHAAAAAAMLVNQGAGALLSWGCAGALVSGLQPGTLLLPRSIKSKTPEILYADEQWHACLVRRLAETGKPSTGMLAESTDILKNPEQKKMLYESSDAIAVDMESAAIATVAQDAHIPFLVVRAIADDMETIIPPCISNAMDIYGRIRPAKLLPSVLMHPQIWQQLLQLGRGFSKAKTTLSQVAKMAGPAFLVP